MLAGTGHTYVQVPDDNRSIGGVERFSRGKKLFIRRWLLLAETCYSWRGIANPGSEAIQRAPLKSEPSRITYAPPMLLWIFEWNLLRQNFVKLTPKPIQWKYPFMLTHSLAFWLLVLTYLPTSFAPLPMWSKLFAWYKCVLFYQKEINWKVSILFYRLFFRYSDTVSYWNFSKWGWSQNRKDFLYIKASRVDWPSSNNINERYWSMIL